jgi:hypothetical protein
VIGFFIGPNWSFLQAFGSDRVLFGPCQRFEKCFHAASDARNNYILRMVFYCSNCLEFNAFEVVFQLRFLFLLGIVCLCFPEIEGWQSGNASDC